MHSSSGGKGAVGRKARVTEDDSTGRADRSRFPTVPSGIPRSVGRTGWEKGETYWRIPTGRADRSDTTRRCARRPMFPNMMRIRARFDLNLGP